MSDSTASGRAPVADADRAIDRLLEGSHLASTTDLPRLFAEHGRAIGLADVVVHLADLQQNLLVPFLEGIATSGDRRSEQRIDATLAGRCFQFVEPVTQEPAGDRRHTVVWVPLVDGTERLGVLAMTVEDATVLEDLDGPLWTRVRRLAAVAAELIMAKTMYGDELVRHRRISSMGLAAEMQWALLPPLTVATEDLVLAAGLEPAYEVAGDSFDYAVDDGTTRFAIFDGMGHGLGSAMLASLTVAAYRNSRRDRRSLVTTARDIDEAVTVTHDGAAFSTGILAELDTENGRLSWVSAGHHDPILMRDGRIVRHLQCDHALPFGLDAGLGSGAGHRVGEESLEPGDTILLYTDGVIEARAPDGEFFGVDRLVDLLARNLAAQLPAPETMRRLVHALLEHQQGQLDDDATLMFVQWRPPRPGDLTP